MKRALVIGCAVLTLVGAGLPVFAASLSLSSSSLSAYRTCVLSGTSVSSTSETGDAFVDQTAPGSTNGGASSLSVRSGTLLTANRRAYIKFDFSKCTPVIPASATVNSATLKLFASGGPGSCRTYDAFRVPSSWSESTITWNNQPFGTSTNNPPTAQRSSSVDLANSGTCQNDAGAYVSGWDVTTDVQNIVNLANANNGWMIRDDSENALLATSATFTSHDANSAAQAPELVINYL
jgi:hypothetical protein